jgi:hypothetical protein
MSMAQASERQDDQKTGQSSLPMPSAAPGTALDYKINFKNTLVTSKRQSNKPIKKWRAPKMVPETA